MVKEQLKMVDNVLNLDSSAPSLSLIYGPGRSGTTWLGSIVNSHPDIAYRFEPFGRRDELRRIGNVWASVLSNSKEQQREQLLYDALLPANPQLDKPPFFEKDNVSKFGRSKLWPLAKVLPFLSPLYEHLYTPKGKPPVVFKEVSWGLVSRLLDFARMRCVFILRSPYGTVASCQKGQNAGLMPTWQRDNLDTVLKNCGSNLAEEISMPLSALNEIQRNAVLWRLDAERIIDRIETDPNCLLIVYEELCENPIRLTKQVFKHFDLSWHEQVDCFLEQSTRATQGLRRQEGAIQSYFSVSRKSDEVAMRWKRQLSKADIEAIDRIVRPSRAYRFLQDRENLSAAA